ncbi:heterokaryon incompatibility protein-domain-containing protein [Lineolata rhizophorae]|uniref:Heterokaryon incompatibility protein-domain-containing protein n=1 Tax=Lineolata rhizophorae TaxID=578093 RepID=A0A6A6NWM4_9PEZI|nr:heterokaryon incompatibility protein-domain-containing protein [Lineolata rhizophorae]
MLCSKCTSLKLTRTDFESPPFVPDDKYGKVIAAGTLGELRANEARCPLCRLILEALGRNERSRDPRPLPDEADVASWEMSWSQNNTEYDPITAESETYYGSALYPKLNKAGSTESHAIQLVDGGGDGTGPASGSRGFLRGRSLAEHVDLDMARGWLGRCRKEHGQSCVKTYLNIPAHPAQLPGFLVIDVQKYCLVPLPFSSPAERVSQYAALSYVWGQTNRPVATKATLAQFSEPGAFQRVLVPKTIRDAIEVTRELGLPFLWADSLCIVQDDKNTKDLLISNMDAVYGHAELTVVAASGNHAQAGLSGLAGSDSNGRMFPMEDLGNGLHLGVLTELADELMNCDHAKRGWTYQEGCLSSRCLVFLNGMCSFHCRAAVWREDVMAETDLVKPFESANTLGRTMNPAPLKRYEQHLTAYLERNLTYPSDALNAFAGIQKATATSLHNTRVWYGAPAAVFDWALLWDSVLKVTRRELFPSWSMMGFEGHVLPANVSWPDDDQRWLLHRTWIEWYIVTGDGKVELVWHPERDDAAISPLVEEALKERSIETNQEGEQLSSDVDEVVTSDDEDDVEEEEDCPTYGIPLAGNPYGRSMNNRFLSQNSSQPRSETFTTTKMRLPLGTLCFSTLSVCYRVLPSKLVTHHRQESNTLLLCDRDNTKCGIIWNSTLPKSTPDTANGKSEPHELILLSYASPNTTSELDREGAAEAAGLDRPYWPSKQLPGVDGEHIGPYWHAWDYFNVMMIAPKVVDDDDAEGGRPCLSERVGLGLLHKDALDKSLELGPQWKNVFLY